MRLLSHAGNAITIVIILIIILMTVLKDLVFMESLLCTKHDHTHLIGIKSFNSTPTGIP